MTKHIAILLSFLLLISNIGLAFNVHYCGENIASISFDYKTVEPCFSSQSSPEKVCCAIQNTHNDCCKNSKVDIKKSSSDNIIVKNNQIELSNFTLATTWKPFNPISSKEINLTKKGILFYCDCNAPPFYKLYSQLIFYA